MDLDPLDPIDGAMCLKHISDALLRRQLAGEATERRCRLCGRTAPEGDEAFAVAIDAVAAKFLEVVAKRWVDAAEYGSTGMASVEDTLTVLYESVGSTVDEDVEKRLHEIIARATTIDDWVSLDDGEDRFDFSWRQFVETVQSESRFVVLDRTMQPSVRPNEPPVRLAEFLQVLIHFMHADTAMVVVEPQGTEFFRGRMTDDVYGLLREAKAHPAKELGSAPHTVAGASRMSARGIPMFYGASTQHLAVSEIAAHSVYDRAVTGTFLALRPLRILDFTRTPHFPSPFDETADERREALGFIREFVRAITAPVLLDGREHLEYVPSQLITEYLRWVPAERLDGVAYPAARDFNESTTWDTVSDTAKNYVLFFEGPDIADLPLVEEGLLLRGLQPEPSLGIDPASVEALRVGRSVSFDRV